MHLQSVHLAALQVHQTSLKRYFSSLFAAFLRQTDIPRMCNVSLWTASSHHLLVFFNLIVESSVKNDWDSFFVHSCAVMFLF